MTITCPHCHQKADADEIYAGQEVECPYCGKKFVYGQNAGRIQVPRAPGPRQTPESAAQAKIDISRTEASFCFWLGYCLPMFGILVAAVCYRAKGVANAIVGLIILAIVCISGFLGFLFLENFVNYSMFSVMMTLFMIAFVVTFFIGTGIIVSKGKALGQSQQS